MMTLEDRILHQMGRNLRKYQEIEADIKRLIRLASQTIRMGSNDIRPNTESNSPDVGKTTLGNLLLPLEQTKHEPEFKGVAENAETFQIGLSYHIPIISLIDKDNFEHEFKKILAERNRFIHHSSFQNNEKFLYELQEAHRQAERFHARYLKTTLQTVSEYIRKILDEHIRHIQDWRLNFTRMTAWEYFEFVYQQHKREDGWAVWTEVLLAMKTEYADVLAGLKEESSYQGKQISWKNIVLEVYPRWRFGEENTPKGGKRVLVKVDSSKIVLKDGKEWVQAA